VDSPFPRSWELRAALIEFRDRHRQWIVERLDYRKSTQARQKFRLAGAEQYTCLELARKQCFPFDLSLSATIFSRRY
jgi:hypothetical protein